MIKKLFNQALNVRQNAYAPYSNFKVGAALLASNGKIYVGANVENVSFPCGICAEAVAISAMVADGVYEISDIVIVADSQKLITPCGACLQRIIEFSKKDTLIHAADLKGIKKSYKPDELLPAAFGENLKK